MSALKEQIGGDHYKTMRVQPLEATYNNFGYEGLQAAVYCKVDKYLRRNKGGLRKHIEDIGKARHVLDIQEEFALKELESADVGVNPVDPQPNFMYGDLSK